MKPEPTPDSLDPETLRAPKVLLAAIVDPLHPLVLVARMLDWRRFEGIFKTEYASSRGRPACPTRLLIGLHYLKYAFDLSDDACLARFSETPVWQYFCGYEYLVHQQPCHSTTLVKWRKRIKEVGAEFMLDETIAVGLRHGIINKKEFDQVVIDSTTQPKNIARPNTTKTLQDIRKKLIKESKRIGLKFKNSYERKGDKALFKYRLCRQRKDEKNAKKFLRNLRTYLGRVIRSLKKRSVDLSEKLISLISTAEKVLRGAEGKAPRVYSIHEPTECCFVKGKVFPRFKYGSKVSIATTARSCWLLTARSFSGMISDVRTLHDTVWTVKRIHGFWPKEVYLDKGYRGCEEECGMTKTFVKGCAASRSGPTKKWMKRRSSVEPIIGHLKHDHRMGRNFLRGRLGDQMNPVLAGCGFNIRKMLSVVKERAKFVYEHFYGRRAVKVIRVLKGAGKR
ncbi:MAG TPA: IS5 family transposase [Oligoflexus sp.]|uniref:IS5 family transposase n=1 Tax=Oligoflexus sp. TaxID=1971216 RepID=UPI002D40BC3A|nr:IS5 family transposase [Oligoflexus sp.]HYX33968.1 IS5 family transposase [Oligoflexus sp.]